MFSKLIRSVYTYRLPILSGILIGTSFIPFPPWGILFSFVPLWLFWLRASSLREILVGGWFTQFVMTLIGFNWVAHTVHEFGHLPWPVAVLVLVLFCTFANLYVPLAGLLWGLLRNTIQLPRWAQLALLPFLMALCEYAYPMIFESNLGYVWLWAKLPVFQLADCIGFQGLSALTMCFSLAFLIAWCERRTRKGMYVFTAALAVFLLLNLLGSLRANALVVPDTKTTALVVQANIGHFEKRRALSLSEYRKYILAKYLALTRQGLEDRSGRDIDFAVWPETALPYIVRIHSSVSGEVAELVRFVRKHSLPIVTGSLSYVQQVDKVANSFLIFTKNGTVEEPPYHKSILLAFGEYLPGAEWFPRLKDWIPEVGDFARGDGPSVKKLGDLTLGPQICYEGLFPDFARTLANQGAEMFVNLTNDSWYGDWQEPYQHLYLTLARGIEFRRPVIRSTSTGISAVMSADGTILDQSPVNGEWWRVFTIPYANDPLPTFYQRYGPWLDLGPLWLGVGILFVGAWKGRTERI